MDNIEALKKELLTYSPNNYLQDIQEGILFAEREHKGQNRYSGEPYVTHPLRTAIILAKMGFSSNTILAGLLHNVISNSPWREEEIKREITNKFGEDVLTVITKCSNINKATASTDTEHEIITKYILSSNKDLRPILVKLADTLDNVRTIEYMPQERLNSKLQKIFHIYGPLAEYLNLDCIKKELEERALKVYRPDEYEAITKKMLEHNFTEDLKEKYIIYLKDVFSYFQPSIYGRVKSVNSIYNKLKKQLKEGSSVRLDSIRDLMAFRVIVNNEDEAFKALEIIMDRGDLITEEFDDYITHPKPNGYKALQGPIVLPEVSPNVLEVQILTHDMHYYNTYGPASHIAYKESKSRYSKPTDKYGWVEQVHKNINKNISEREITRSNAIKANIFEENVYAFTPKGKIIQLDKGDTVVDFAFRVHTSIGCSMVSAKVNGFAAKSDHILETGDTVEIKTQPSKKTVNPDWVKYAHSQSTISKMKKHMQ